MASFTRFRDHTQRRVKVGRTSLGRVISLLPRPLPDNTQQTNIHAPGGIRTQDRSRRAAVDLRLRLHGHWDRHKEISRVSKNLEAQTIPILLSVISGSSTSTSARKSTSFLNVNCYFQHILRPPFYFMVTT
jgi:hypothetical protein